MSTNKVVATVTDNGTNFVKVFREFGIQLPLDLFDESTLDHFGNDNDSDNESVCDEVTTDNQILNDIPAMPIDLPDFQSNTILSVHYRCVSHTLNLIATTDVINCIKSTRTLAARHDEAITRCEVLWKQLRSQKKRNFNTTSRKSSDEINSRSMEFIILFSGANIFSKRKNIRGQ